MSSKSLSINTTALTRLQQALGEKVAGTRIGIGAHTPIADIIDILHEVKDLGIDCLITLGAGSLTDGAKLVNFALANNAYTAEEIDTLWGGDSHNPKKRKTVKAPQLPLICIPTSLSGGEYQHIIGGTETISRAKRTFETGVDPTLVIQDPELSLTTPENIWLSTGVRAVDHCVETLCSLQSNPAGDLNAEKGLAALIPGLLLCKQDLGDLQARHLCQLGVVDAMSAVSSGVPLGASHAIGHQLGPFGVGHGETSCILLPAVCKYNAAKGANNERQAVASRLLLRDTAVLRVLETRGVDSKHADLGDILDIVFKELGMPRTLKDVHIGRDKLDALAVNSLNDVWIRTNAVPIIAKVQVLDILEIVIGDKVNL